MPSRSSGPFGAAVESALERVVGAVSSLEAPLSRVVIDGRSGSGKTTLAARLTRRWPRTPAPVCVALDDIYPGWDGLAAASRIVVTDILEPHAAGRTGTYRRWDWNADRARSDDEPDAVRSLPADAPLLVEGCGALTPASRALSDLAIWVDAPEEARKRRALGRDGDGYAPHWDRWAAQERIHIAEHDPAGLADLVFQLP